MNQHKIGNLLGLSLLLFCSTGCLQLQKNEDVVTFQVRTTDKSNQGTPFYMIVKETSMTDFLMHDYNEIAKSLSQEKEDDPSCYVKECLHPGRTKKITVKPASPDKSLGVYFLFTHPKESWKCIINDPKSQNVKILLGENECQAVNIFNQ